MASAAELGISEQDFEDAMNLEKIYSALSRSGGRCSKCDGNATHVDCSTFQFLCSSHAVGRANCKKIGEDRFSSYEVSKLEKKAGGGGGGGDSYHRPPPSTPRRQSSSSAAAPVKSSHKRRSKKSSGGKSKGVRKHGRHRHYSSSEDDSDSSSSASSEDGGRGTPAHRKSPKHASFLSFPPQTSSPLPYGGAASGIDPSALAMPGMAGLMMQQQLQQQQLQQQLQQQQLQQQLQQQGQAPGSFGDFTSTMMSPQAPNYFASTPNFPSNMPGGQGAGPGFMKGPADAMMMPWGAGQGSSPSNSLMLQQQQQQLQRMAAAAVAANQRMYNPQLFNSTPLMMQQDPFMQQAYQQRYSTQQQGGGLQNAFPSYSTQSVIGGKLSTNPFLSQSTVPRGFGGAGSGQPIPAAGTSAYGRGEINEMGMMAAPQPAPFGGASAMKSISPSMMNQFASGLQGGQYSQPMQQNIGTQSYLNNMMRMPGFLGAGPSPAPPMFNSVASIPSIPFSINQRDWWD